MIKAFVVAVALAAGAALAMAHGTGKRRLSTAARSSPPDTIIWNSSPRMAS